MPKVYARNFWSSFFFLVAVVLPIPVAAHEEDANCREVALLCAMNHTQCGYCTDGGCITEYPSSADRIGEEPRYLMNCLVARESRCKERVESCKDVLTATRPNQNLTEMCKSPTQELPLDSRIFHTSRFGNIRTFYHQQRPYSAEPGIASNNPKFVDDLNYNRDVVFSASNVLNNQMDLLIRDSTAKEDSYLQITNWLGYKGGATYSPNNKLIAFHASKPIKFASINRFNDLFANRLVDPSQTEIYFADIGYMRDSITNADGVMPEIKQVKQVTKMNSWGPVFLNDSQHILFSSNVAYDLERGAKDKNGNELITPANLFLVELDGFGLKRVTFSDSWSDNGTQSIFDGDATFSEDGTKIVWASTRNSTEGDINLFMADWVYYPTVEQKNRTGGKKGPNPADYFSAGSSAQIGEFLLWILFFIAVIVM